LDSLAKIDAKAHTFFLDNNDNAGSINEEIGELKTLRGIYFSEYVSSFSQKYWFAQ